MRRKFQNNEILFIKENYKRMSTEYIGNHLGRSSRSISSKIFKLGLKLSEEEKMNKGKPNKIGRLTILERDYSRIGRFRYFWCLCDCGNKVSRLLADMRRERGVSSCGCYASELKYDAEGQVAFHGAYLRYERRAMKKKIPFKVTEEEFIKIISMRCHYCGTEPRDFNPYIDSHGNQRSDSQATIDRSWVKMNGVDRKSSDDGYTLENCLSCCFPCNRAKGDMIYENYLNYLKQMIEFRLHSNCLNKLK
jgi:hypothetical protein